VLSGALRPGPPGAPIEQIDTLSQCPVPDLGGVVGASVRGRWMVLSAKDKIGAGDRFAALVTQVGRTRYGAKGVGITYPYDAVGFAIAPLAIVAQASAQQSCSLSVCSTRTGCRPGS
jgi:hypothetical protein